MRWDFDTLDDWHKFKGRGYATRYRRVDRYFQSAQFQADSKAIVGHNATTNGRVWVPRMYEAFTSPYAIEHLDNFYYDIAMNNMQAKIAQGHKSVMLDVEMTDSRNFLVLQSDRLDVTVWSWWLDKALYDKAKANAPPPINRWD
jgi:hypothetical protein